MNEGQLYNLLELRFPKEEYALLPGVRNGTGWERKTTREADAVALSLWPSRGIELHGFEIKVSRGDWLREKKNPAKADEIAQFCDRWWLVVSEPEIAPPEEVPPAWGILVPRGKTLFAVRAASPLKPKPMDKLFVAAVLRRATKHVIPQVQIDAAVQAKIKEEAESLTRSKDWTIHDLERKLKTNDETVKKFETASGLSISSWNAGEVGEAVRAILDSKSLESRIEQERRHLENLNRQVEHSLKALAEFTAIENRRAAVHE